jgi:hypothetical protein
MTTEGLVSVMVFTRDLRISDNLALTMAARASKVVCVFIHDDALQSGRPMHPLSDPLRAMPAWNRARAHEQPAPRRARQVIGGGDKRVHTARGGGGQAVHQPVRSSPDRRVAAMPWLRRHRAFSERTKSVASIWTDRTTSRSPEHSGWHPRTSVAPADTGDIEVRLATMQYWLSAHRIPGGPGPMPRSRWCGIAEFTSRANCDVAGYVLKTSGTGVPYSGRRAQTIVTFGMR